MQTPTFGARLSAAMAAKGPLCVGIDPHASLLTQWGLRDTPKDLLTFSMRVLEATGEHAAAIKPQSAFFERHGSAGIAVLEQVLAAAKAADVLTILDVKRGDIGSTMGGYSEAFLLPGAPLEADAITLSPYLGLGSLNPAYELATAHGKGLFVLCLTSNPEGQQVQHAQTVVPGQGSISLAAAMANGVAEWNATERSAQAAAGAPDAASMGSFGLVVGATVGDAARQQGVDLAGFTGPLLAPGVGAQGAGAKELQQVFGEARQYVLPSTSRGVLAAGPNPEALKLAAIRGSAEARDALES